MNIVESSDGVLPGHTCCAKIIDMPNRSSKPRMPDPSELAFAIVQRVTGEAPVSTPAIPATEDVASSKNPHAVALGKLGGAKGGKARAKKLSAKRRIEIAANAARTRWGSKKK